MGGTPAGDAIPAEYLVPYLRGHAGKDKDPNNQPLIRFLERNPEFPHATCLVGFICPPFKSRSF